MTKIEVFGPCIIREIGGKDFKITLENDIAVAEDEIAIINVGEKGELFSLSIMTKEHYKLSGAKK